MPCKVEHADNWRVVIACDGDGCRAEHDEKQIAANGGLLEMGWLRRFNEQARRQEYFCPQHHPKEQASGN